MAELVSTIATYALWLYLLLGALMVRELRAMWRAGTARDQAVFGLEREAAASRALRSLITLFLLVTIAAGVYTVANVIAPTLPSADLERLAGSPLVEEPPPLVFPTDTATPAPTATTHLPRIVTATPTPGGAPAPTTDLPLCRNPAVRIHSPAPGTTLDGPLPVVVTVRLDAATGERFRLRLGAGEAPTIWLPVGAEHTEPVTGAAVETLSPEGRAPGLYGLRLERVGPDGVLRSDASCTVPVRVP